MNPQIKQTFLIIMTVSSFLFSITAFSRPLTKEFYCANSPDGKPQMIDNELICNLRSHYEDERLTQRTFGIVQWIDLASNIRLEINPQTLLTLLGEETITFPKHPLSAAIVMGKEQVLPISMQINPVFTKQGEICSLKFVDVKPNISDFESPKLPSWVSTGIEQFLNKSSWLQGKILNLANDAVVKVRHKLAFCGAN